MQIRNSIEISIHGIEMLLGTSGLSSPQEDHYDHLARKLNSDHVFSLLLGPWKLLGKSISRFHKDRVRNIRKGVVTLIILEVN